MSVTPASKLRPSSASGASPASSRLRPCRVEHRCDGASRDTTVQKLITYLPLAARRGPRRMRKSLRLDGRPAPVAKKCECPAGRYQQRGINQCAGMSPKQGRGEEGETRRRGEGMRGTARGFTRAGAEFAAGGGVVGVCPMPVAAVWAGVGRRWSLIYFELPPVPLSRMSSDMAWSGGRSWPDQARRLVQSAWGADQNSSSGGRPRGSRPAAHR